MMGATSIAVLRGTFKITSYSFENLRMERLEEVNQWIVFKIQEQNKPQILSAHLAETMLESFKDSFSNDFNMIIEEFNFYQ